MALRTREESGMANATPAIPVPPSLRCVRKLALYSDVIHIRLEIIRRTRWWCLKCVIVYLARDIPAFVMYCVNGASGSSVLIESTDSMIKKMKKCSACHGALSRNP